LRSIRGSSRKSRPLCCKRSTAHTQSPERSGLITTCPLSATDQDGNCALRHDFIGLAAKDQTPQTAPSMRRHHDQVTPAHIGSLDNSIRRQSIYHMNRITCASSAIILL
jgi:hypothetical protein